MFDHARPLVPTLVLFVEEAETETGKHWGGGGRGRDRWGLLPTTSYGNREAGKAPKTFYSVFEIIAVHTN